jgi:hypothetical protein
MISTPKFHAARKPDEPEAGFLCGPLRLGVKSFFAVQAPNGFVFSNPLNWVCFVKSRIPQPRRHNANPSAPPENPAKSHDPNDRAPNWVRFFKRPSYIM